MLKAWFFTTQNPARVEVATDGLSLPRLIVGKETVIHTRRPESWRALSETDAALLDFLRNRGESSDLSPQETVDKLLDYFREPGRFERLLKVAPSEPPRVRAMLGAIGQQLGQPKNRLSTLACPRYAGCHWPAARPAEKSALDTAEELECPLAV